MKFTFSFVLLLMIISYVNASEAEGSHKRVAELTQKALKLLNDDDSSNDISGCATLEYAAECGGILAHYNLGVIYQDGTSPSIKKNGEKAMLH